eukprot:gene1493-1465_t
MFLSEEHIAQMAQTFEVIYAPDAPQAAAAIAQHGSRVRVVLTIGSVGLSPAQIDALPALTLICALGAGYENVGVDYAKARGIVVATGAGTNDDCVADHTWGLLIAAQRRILPLDKATRAGVWRTALPLPPNVSHKRLGIIGLGTIGKKIAQRALGFEIEVGYHNRSARTDVPYRYFADVAALAEWADFLVIATPGGAGTKHLVNADVLNALGPRGVVVNIARGSVIDTAALAAALREGRIAAAGLDVYESEPAPPAELLDLDNVVLTPHVAGWSPEAVQASVDRFMENARRHLAGEAPVTPLQARLRAFAAERQWQPFHTPKNLAMALMVEAAELAEIFQWMTPEQSLAVAGDPALKEPIADEVADVLLYLLQLADHAGVDLAEAVEYKLRKNAVKHPVPDDLK